MTILIALLLATSLPLEHAASAYASEKGVALRSPEGVGCTDAGVVVVADTGNRRLLFYRFDGKALKGGSEVAFEGLGRPTQVQIDSRGNVLALDSATRRIVRVSETGGMGGVVQPKGVPAATGFFPVSFKLDAKDNLYVLDGASGRVVVLSQAGAFVRQVDLPRGAVVLDLAVDSRGAIWAIDARASVLYVAEQKTFAKVGQPLTSVMTWTSGLVATAQGPLLAVDRHGNGLVVLGRDGGFLGRRLGIGANDGSIYYPGQVCVDARGDVFVADTGNHRMQAFAPSKTAALR